MLFSMTGYGSARHQSKTHTSFVEIRSVNGKTADISFRTNTTLADFGELLRNRLIESVERGKCECNIRIESREKPTGALDITAIHGLHSVLAPLARKLKLAPVSLDALLHITNSSKKTETNAELSAIEKTQLEKTFLQALENFIASRKKEGTKLQKHIIEELRAIESIIAPVTRLDKKRSASIREKLTAQLTALQSTSLDTNRLEQEMIYYLERLDFTEEIVRLRSHCETFLTTIKNEKNPGRKLGFITQEIGRELNTLGSKANDFTIQSHVIRAKDALEKIKEQLANVL
jgi:uncharacterized protein (TIGR00255 family)